MVYLVTKFYSYYQLDNNGKIKKDGLFGEDGICGDNIIGKCFNNKKQAIEFYNNLELDEPILDLTKEYQLCVFGKDITDDYNKILKRQENFGNFKNI